MPDPAKRLKRGGSNATSSIITDPRFSSIQTDPRYRLPSKRHTHVKLDKRFAHVLRDKEFSRNAAVDRYGRKLARDDTAKQLEKFYQLDEGSEESDREEASNISAGDNEDVLRELRTVEKRDYDPARDGGFSASSSSEDSSSDEEDEEEDIDDVEFPSREGAEIPLGEVTHRIAIVNLDWDNIRAEDLMAVFSSFMPTGGSILKASVYPSEFGKERMEKEEMEGPPKEIFSSSRNLEQAHSGSDSDDEEAKSDEPRDEDEEDEKVKQLMLKEDKGEEFNSTQLRRYQLERLRYFYAIIEFSSKEVAKRVYDAVDGTEYLSSANFFDLRFVPAETDFSGDTPREECDKLPDGYQPNDFVTDALQHSRVKLTWDADDNARKKAQGKAFSGRKEIDENDIKAYLGTDSSGDEDNQATGGAGEAPDSKASKKETERQRMRALLGLSDQQITKPKAGGPVGDMEITFTSGLAGEPARDSVFENEPEREETTKEKYIRKERERRQRRKGKLKSTKQEAIDSANGKDTEPIEAAENGSLGFDDPFFNDPEEEQRMAAKKKEEKRLKREQRAADTAASAAQRAELELLMADDKTTGIKHFDMNEVEAAEKRARKKGKKGMQREDAAPVDDFKVDVSDPRFERLYESHEFAIDPTNPKFKATSGMRALLEEGRKRRRGRDEHSEAIAQDAGSAKPKKQKKSSRTESGNEDWKKLVSKVKQKSQKV
ncbi:hypothetical protein V8E54_012666 [Elaphomyces granulatus]